MPEIRTQQPTRPGANPDLVRAIEKLIEKAPRSDSVEVPRPTAPPLRPTVPAPVSAPQPPPPAAPEAPVEPDSALVRPLGSPEPVNLLTAQVAAQASVLPSPAERRTSTEDHAAESEVASAGPVDSGERVQRAAGAGLPEPTQAIRKQERALTGSVGRREEDRIPEPASEPSPPEAEQPEMPARSTPAPTTAPSGRAEPGRATPGQAPQLPTGEAEGDTAREPVSTLQQTGRLADVARTSVGAPLTQEERTREPDDESSWWGQQVQGLFGLLAPPPPQPSTGSSVQPGWTLVTDVGGRPVAQIPSDRLEKAGAVSRSQIFGAVSAGVAGATSALAWAFAGGLKKAPPAPGQVPPPPDFPPEVWSQVRPEDRQSLSERWESLPESERKALLQTAGPLSDEQRARLFNAVSRTRFEGEPPDYEVAQAVWKSAAYGGEPLPDGRSVPPQRADIVIVDRNAEPGVLAEVRNGDLRFGREFLTLAEINRPAAFRNEEGHAQYESTMSEFGLNFEYELTRAKRMDGYERLRDRGASAELRAADRRGPHGLEDYHLRRKLQELGISATDEQLQRYRENPEELEAALGAAGRSEDVGEILADCRREAAADHRALEQYAALRRHQLREALDHLQIHPPPPAEELDRLLDSPAALDEYLRANADPKDLEAYLR
ncbi:MAG: hypothetical protein AB1758_31205, partial [Candidatus Eremiobacterota bacterium]